MSMMLRWFGLIFLAAAMPGCALVQDDRRGPAGGGSDAFLIDAKVIEKSGRCHTVQADPDGDLYAVDRGVINRYRIGTRLRLRVRPARVQSCPGATRVVALHIVPRSRLSAAKRARIRRWRGGRSVAYHPPLRRRTPRRTGDTHTRPIDLPATAAGPVGRPRSILPGAYRTPPSTTTRRARTTRDRTKSTAARTAKTHRAARTRSRDTVLVRNPKSGRHPLDRCYVMGRFCKLESATAFCRRLGFRKAVSASTYVARITQVHSDRRVCRTTARRRCRAYRTIRCLRG